MKTCETCKHATFHAADRATCLLWQINNEGDFFRFDNPPGGGYDTTFTFEPPEGFGCTSHQKREFALGMVGECSRSYLKQEKDKEDQS